ncbi:hypothetical protein ACWEP5_36295 [Nocardia niigatensis]
MIKDPDEAIAEATRLRGATITAEERLELAQWLSNTIVDTVASRSEYAHALHLVTVPLSGQIEPQTLVSLLDKPIKILYTERSDLASLRFAALLARTDSMAMSKLDNYRAAFTRINRAYTILRKAHEIEEAQADLVFLEAMQQIYLQESGQLARNAEAALVEWDHRILTQQIHAPDEPHPPKRRLDPKTRAAVGTLAWGSTMAAFDASRLVDWIQKALKHHDGETLYTPTWVVTTENMAMRALLLYATTVALQDRNNNATPWTSMIPSMYRKAVATPGAQLTKNHVMDLIRIGLHYSFLEQGYAPYRDVRKSKQQPAATIPSFLRDDTGKLDTYACSTSLLENNHNAGILDTLAHERVYSRFQSLSKGQFEPWVCVHRGMRVGRIGKPHEQLRLAKPIVHLELTDNAAAVSGRRGGPPEID